MPEDTDIRVTVCYLLLFFECIKSTMIHYYLVQ